eukprot:1428726-Pleurochrysis_carterae.AAC.1
MEVATATATATAATATAMTMDAFGAPLRACPVAEHAVSAVNGTPLVVTWVNRATHPLTLSVLDYEGAERPMTHLRSKPETSIAFNSNAGVVWRARALNGELLLQVRRRS